jgi:hypothetical protein
MEKKLQIASLGKAKSCFLKRQCGLVTAGHLGFAEALEHF